MVDADRTLVFTDVVDSTQVVERLGDAAAAALWARHDRAARDLLHRHGGREIDRADGFFALFAAADGAAAFALAYHAAVAALGLRARVGLHTAAVTLRANEEADVERGAKPLEVEGLAKPFAARLMALAQGGQTLASAATRAALQAAPGGAVQTHSHGHYRLKGIAEPVEVVELALTGAATFVPPPDSPKSYRVVQLPRRQGGLWQPVREVPNNLPAERDAFVGRSAELHALAQRLDGGERLVTVLGPGGAGKTRLVRRYARAWLGDWPGGVHFCDLSDACTTEGVIDAVASALGVPLVAGDAAAQVGHAIAARGTCLLILDNAEQVLGPVAALAARWLDRAAGASVLVTSRELLRLDGEGVFPLEPFPVGDDPVDAIELFETRARAQHPGFRVDDGNRAAAAEAVRLLDGLPLAIELAAARVRLLTPAQIVERLRDRFALLAGVRPGAAARQATLRAAIDWSWDLLLAWERAACAQCSVFEGGFTLAAAESVLDLSPWPEAPTAMDAVQALLDKSLLRTVGSSASGRPQTEEPRFGMYVSIQAYARERLQANGDAAAVEARHGRCYADLSTTHASEVLRGRDGPRQLQVLAVERENLSTACRRALAHGDVASASACLSGLLPVLMVHGPMTLALTLGAPLFACADADPPTRLVICRTYGRAAGLAGEPSIGAAALDEGLALARRLGRTQDEGEILLRLGELRFSQMRIDEARAHLEAALVACRTCGDRLTEGLTLGRLAALDHHQGRWDAFEPRCREALALFRQYGGSFREPQILNLLGMREHDLGHVDQALALFTDARDRARAKDNSLQEATSLGNIGAVLAELGRDDEALDAQQASLALHRRLGNRSGEGIQLGGIGALHARQGRLDAAREHFETALAIARESGNRRHELYLLGSLGRLHADAGRLDAAAGSLRDGLAAARAAGYPISAGRLLAGLGRVHWLAGDLSGADRALAEGEALLRGAGDRIELPHLLCTRGHVDLAQGQLAAARAALREAEAAADEMRVLPGSDLRIAIDSLRRALGP